MEASAPETGTSTSTVDSPLLQSAWSDPPPGAELVLSQALAAVDRLAAAGGPADADGDDPSSSQECFFREVLNASIRSYGAERAFLVEVEAKDLSHAEADGTSAPALSGVHAVDVDGEQVPQPEKKIPPGILADVVRTGAPVQHRPSDGEDGNPATSHCVAFPLAVTSGVRGVLIVENRFRELQLGVEALLTSRVHCRVIAALLESDALWRENRSLWTDITRLREARPPEISGPPAATSTRPRRTKSAKRSDLKGDYSMIVGSSPCLIEIFQILDRISKSNAPVLINGDSGTGKELIAGAVHRNSPRRDKPFVSENCGALTETLLESELFGYMRGAFTGATKDRKGLFELASGGTLFLDEVGDMSPSMQKKLLRVLQEKVVRRVGGKDLIQVDVRIISATNKDLGDEVRTGHFREDLFYRLNVINLRLPPLRDRREDVPEIAAHFVEMLAQESGEKKEIDPTAMERLAQHSWPGDIRELQNEIRRLYALADGMIRVEDLSESVLSTDDDRRGVGDVAADLADMTLKQAVEHIEELMIRGALVECRGNKSLVAKKLQVPKTSLYNKIHKYGLSRL